MMERKRVVSSPCVRLWISCGGRVVRRGRGGMGPQILESKLREESLNDGLGVDMGVDWDVDESEDVIAGDVEGHVGVDGVAGDVDGRGFTKWLRRVM
jgi:hypothetical protein